MKKLILGMAICLLILGFVPTHELGHIIVAKALGGEVRDVYWLSFSSITDSQGEYYGGGVCIENLSCDWKWVMVASGGGMFQSLLYVGLGLFLSSRRFLRSKKRKALKTIFSACFFLGMFGLVDIVCDLWLVNHVFMGY